MNGLSWEIQGAGGRREEQERVWRERKKSGCSVDGGGKGEGEGCEKGRMNGGS